MEGDKDGVKGRERAISYVVNYLFLFKISGARRGRLHKKFIGLRAESASCTNSEILVHVAFTLQYANGHFSIMNSFRYIEY